MDIATLPQNLDNGNGLGVERWTPKMVVDRLETAASTLCCIPATSLKARAHDRGWPAVIMGVVDARSLDESVVRLGIPPADAVTRMDDAMEWLHWLAEPDQVRLVWLRASRTPWKMIMRRFGISRSTAFTRWNAAILQIVAILNLPNRMVCDAVG
ncbi:MAG: DUF6362 family protein [Magnetococcus sp. YQC-5]